MGICLWAHQTSWGTRFGGLWEAIHASHSYLAHIFPFLLFSSPLFLALCQSNSLHSHFSSDLSLLNIRLFSSCALWFPHRLPLSSQFSVPFLSPFLFPFPHQFVGYSWIRQALTSPSTPVLLFLQKSFSSIFPSSQSFCHDQELLWMAKVDGYTDIQTA